MKGDQPAVLPPLPLSASSITSGTGQDEVVGWRSCWVPDGVDDRWWDEDHGTGRGSGGCVAQRAGEGAVEHTDYLRVAHVLVRRKACKVWWQRGLDQRPGSNRVGVRGPDK